MPELPQQGSEPLAIVTAAQTRRFGALAAVDGLDLAIPAGTIRRSSIKEGGSRLLTATP